MSLTEQQRELSWQITCGNYCPILPTPTRINRCKDTLLKDTKPRMTKAQRANMISDMDIVLKKGLSIRETYNFMYPEDGNILPPIGFGRFRLLCTEIRSAHRNNKPFISKQNRVKQLTQEGFSNHQIMVLLGLSLKALYAARTRYKKEPKNGIS